MKISVIIPTYNRKHTLNRAIHSVLSQTSQPREIIAVDDGSTDGTKKWLAKMYPAIRYIHQSNSGVSAARNVGIKTAQGDWLAFLDSDDEWLPQKLERQVEAVKKDADSLFCHTNETWIRNGVRVNQGKKHRKYGGLIFDKCLDICRISPSSALFKKSILDDTGLFDEELSVCEDYDLWLRITASYPVIFLDEPLIKKYGGHEDQLSRVPAGIEQYRIQSLEKILHTVELTPAQSDAARKMLLRKMNIYLGGLKKRGRSELIEKIEKKIAYWTII